MNPNLKNYFFYTRIRRALRRREAEKPPAVNSWRKREIDRCRRLIALCGPQEKEEREQLQQLLDKLLVEEEK